MSPEKVRSRQPQDQPAEGDRHVIERELARTKNETEKEKGRDRQDKSKINPEATPGTGMLPPVDDDDDPNMAPSG
jgi:hypothetical protein